MSQSLLNKKLFHKLVNFFMPENCRDNLERAFIENRIAANDFLHSITHNESKVIAAMKDDRRTRNLQVQHERRYERT